MQNHYRVESRLQLILFSKMPGAVMKTDWANHSWITVKLTQRCSMNMPRWSCYIMRSTFFNCSTNFTYQLNRQIPDLCTLTHFNLNMTNLGLEVCTGKFLILLPATSEGFLTNHDSFYRKFDQAHQFPYKTFSNHLAHSCIFLINPANFHTSFEKSHLFLQEGWLNPPAPADVPAE